MPKSIPKCELVHPLALFRHRIRVAEGTSHDPTTAKRMPQWLTIDLLVIVVSLAIIGIFTAID